MKQGTQTDTRAPDHLEPCPFCGDVAPSVRVRVYDDFVSVECDRCGARGEMLGDEATPVASRKQSAIKTWNRVSGLVYARTKSKTRSRK